MSLLWNTPSFYTSSRFRIQLQQQLDSTNHLEYLLRLPKHSLSSTCSTSHKRRSRRRCFNSLWIWFLNMSSVSYKMLVCGDLLRNFVAKHVSTWKTCIFHHQDSECPRMSCRIRNMHCHVVVLWWQVKGIWKSLTPVQSMSFWYTGEFSSCSLLLSSVYWHSPRPPCHTECLES